MRTLPKVRMGTLVPLIALAARLGGKDSQGRPGSWPARGIVFALGVFWTGQALTIALMALLLFVPDPFG